MMALSSGINCGKNNRNYQNEGWSLRLEYADNANAKDRNLLKLLKTKLLIGKQFFTNQKQS